MPDSSSDALLSREGNATMMVWEAVSIGAISWPTIADICPQSVVTTSTLFVVF